MQQLGLFAVRLSRIFAYIGAIGIVAMMLLICLDVVMRDLFRTSFNSTPEVVARYFMVGIAFLPISFLELKRQMISVELLEFVMTPKMRKASDLMVMLAAIVVYSLLAWTGWTKAIKETNSGTFVELVSWQMPVWHSFYLPPIGFTLGAVGCVVTAFAIVSTDWNERLEADLNER